MSILYMNAVWQLECDSPIRKLILLSLADNANDQGVSWPSVATIASRCSLSERAVQIHILEMTDDGLLKVMKRTNNSSVYKLLISTGARGAPVNVVHRSTPPWGECGAPLGVNVVHPTGERGAPDPSIDPSLEPSRRAKRAKRAPAVVEIPKNIDTPEFRKQWESWMRYRRKLKNHPNFSVLFTGQLKKLSEFTADVAIELLRRSEDSGYTGVVFESDRVRIAPPASAQAQRDGNSADIATLSRKRVADMTEEERRALMRHATS